jgi:hypothetical protein
MGVRGGARSQMEPVSGNGSVSLTGKNTANFAIVGHRAGFLEQEVADLWALLRQFPEMKSSDLICAKAAIMLHFSSDLLCV